LDDGHWKITKFVSRDVIFGSNPFDLDSERGLEFFSRKFVIDWISME
jgi:hypothetical protein